jgi:hypothetical protein
MPEPSFADVVGQLIRLHHSRGERMWVSVLSEIHAEQVSSLLQAEGITFVHVPKYGRQAIDILPGQFEAVLIQDSHRYAEDQCDEFSKAMAPEFPCLILECWPGKNPVEQVSARVSRRHETAGPRCTLNLVVHAGAAAPQNTACSHE